ncbi:MAG: PVC-type heme-binding CxxCH protein [Verrucomicrobiota bacterium]
MKNSAYLQSSLRTLCLLPLLALAPCASAAPVSLFDGQTLTGWEGDTKLTWRIEDGVIIAGSLERKQDKNDFLTSAKEYGNFDLTFKWKLVGTQGFVNGGMQFRSQRIPNSHEMRGYQADLGAGYDGALYDESRRGILVKVPAEVYEKAHKPLGEWNEQRIRAEGPHIQIWVNGVLTADYTEPDPTIPQTGYFGLQIHGNATSIVRYKDIVIEELPTTPDASKKSTSVSGPASRITSTIPSGSQIPAFSDRKFTLNSDDIVVFTGSENMVLEQGSGYLESRLATQWKDAKPRFRHMSWEGDTVFRQNRMMQWGEWNENLEAAGATVIFSWFGQIEAFDDSKSVAEFSSKYGALLDQFSKRTPRLVVIGPPPFEKPADSRIPDNTPRNTRVRELNEAARKLAESRGLIFVDLIEPLLNQHAGPITRDGMHFTEQGSALVSEVIARALGASTSVQETTRAAIVEKNRLWFDTWRCMNWAFAYGDRSTVHFSQGTADHPPFTEELKKYQPLLNHADATIHALATGTRAPAALPVSTQRPNPAAISVQEQMDRFKVRDGFEVNLFADEKLGVVRPIQIRWDQRGRLWVACTPAYPQLLPGEHGNDYILILEDTDGDGRADKATRFADHLTMPMGFEFAPKADGGGLYVCQSTQLVHLPDRNNDDKADGSEVILSGFGTGDTHQDANSLRWGPDGCLWFTQGYHIWSYVETPYGLSELNRSGVWRYNPRTRQLNSFLNESAAGLNCWGTAWDDFGQTFHGSGADYALWHTSPSLIPTLHALKLPTSMAISKGKSMEPEFLESSHLPDDLKGILLKNTYYTSQIQLYRIKDDGSTFTSEEKGDLISGGNEFRPVETRVGPDGAIYVCDWLNPVIGHYQASYRDPRRDLSHGRIWRLTATNRPLVSKPSLANKTAEQLVESLKSNERWERDNAKFALYRMDAEAVLVAVERALPKSGDKDEMRLLYELSGVLAAHERSNSTLLERMLTSDDSRARAWGAHLIGVWANQLEDPISLLKKAVQDEHPRVRMEGVVACAWMPAKLALEAVKTATLVMDKATDRALDYSLTQTIHALSPFWQPALAEGRLDFGDRIHALVRLMTAIGDPNMNARAREVLSSQKLAPQMKDSLLTTLITNGNVEDAEFAMERAPESQVILKALVKQLSEKPKPEYKQLVESLIQSPHIKSRIAGLHIVAASGKDYGTVANIVKKLSDPTTEVSELSAAIAASAKVRGKAGLPELLPFLNSKDEAIRISALQALAPLDPSTVATRAIELLSSTTASRDVAPLLLPLLIQKDGATIVAEAIKASKLPLDSAKLALQWMSESGRDDAPLRDALNAVLGVAPSGLVYNEALIKQLVTNALAKGDAKSGESVFQAAQATCVACHKVGSAGGILGPDLSAIGKALTPEYIVESVLWPKRQVKEGYMLTQIILKNGQQHQGYKASETAESVILKDLSGNPGHPIPRASIASISDTGTLMPDGLTAWMNEQQQLDLFRYLFQLGK